VTWDRRLYFPSEGRRAEDIFFVLKNPTASAGFEPANLSTKGQYATSRPPKSINIYIYISHSGSLNKYKSESLLHYILYTLKTVFKLKYVEAGLIASLQWCKIWIEHQIYYSWSVQKSAKFNTGRDTNIEKAASLQNSVRKDGPYWNGSYLRQHILT
jgi:hypothetical protein